MGSFIRPPQPPGCCSARRRRGHATCVVFGPRAPQVQAFVQLEADVLELRPPSSNGAGSLHIGANGHHLAVHHLEHHRPIVFADDEVCLNGVQHQNGHHDTHLSQTMVHQPPAQQQQQFEVHHSSQASDEAGNGASLQGSMVVSMHTTPLRPDGEHRSQLQPQQWDHRGGAPEPPSTSYWWESAELHQPRSNAGRRRGRLRGVPSQDGAVAQQDTGQQQPPNYQGGTQHQPRSHGEPVGRQHNKQRGSGVRPAAAGPQTDSQADKGSDTAGSMLTVQIRRCTSWQQVQELVRENERCMNHVHVSAALVQLARLVQPTWLAVPPAPTPVQQQQRKHKQQQHQQTDEQQRHRHKQQQRHQQQHTGEPEQPEASSANQGDQQAAGVRRLSLQLASLAHRHMPAMSLWEVTCVMSSLIKLRAPLRKPFYVSMMAHAQNQFRSSSTTAQGLAELLWAVARSGMAGLRPDWARYYCMAVERRWPGFELRGLVRVLHAMAWLQHEPAAAWLQALLQHLGAKLGDAKPQDISNSLWALARLRCKAPPELLDQLCAAALPQLPYFSPQELSNTLWGLARLGHTPCKAWQDAAFACALQLLPELEGQALALMVYAPGLLGLRPPDGWLHTMLQHTQSSGFRGLGPQGMALLVYGAAQLGSAPGRPWLLAFHRHVEAMHGEFHPEAVQLIRTAFAQMEFVPPRAMAARVGRATQQQQQQQQPNKGHHHHGHALQHAHAHTHQQQQQQQQLPAGQQQHPEHASAGASNGNGNGSCSGGGSASDGGLWVGGSGAVPEAAVADGVVSEPAPLTAAELLALQLRVEGGGMWELHSRHSSGNGSHSARRSGSSGGGSSSDSQVAVMKPARFAR